MLTSGLFLAGLLFVVMIQTSQAASEWNQETRDLIVKIHNDRRRQEGGCHINKLEYDEDLEKQARSWAERCVFKHEMKEGRGENLAWNSNKLSEEELIKHAADAWFNEKDRYSYGQYSCGNSAACHYSQMVWGTTNKIGCYSTRCGQLSGAAPNAWYLVCFYTPKGNWNGEKPYEKGCSSPCLEGQTVDNGLCVGESTEEKNNKTNEAKCDDKVGSCGVWASNGECQNNPAYMATHCRKSCKICESEVTCEDLNSNCPEWKRNGQCRANPTYMKHNCKKTCGEC
ncbi:unnamed protein product [Candidula unifasciata]|uniref:ShKT domain-containing protein n=1 Tax=Candidula unifasciata TaxID=100452 RepID=A0A8S3YHI2_9EUPU|nr:unnamed protein product [Candidula unifasciata]